MQGEGKETIHGNYVLNKWPLVVWLGRNVNKALVGPAAVQMINNELISICIYARLIRIIGT